MLVHLPDGYKPEQVAPALAAKIQTLPEVVRRIVDLGPGPGDARLEAGRHRRRHRHLLLRPAQALAARHATRTPTACCASTFPKGTDLSVHTEADLDQVAAELNDRPRKRLGYRKPIEEIGHLLAA